MTHVLDPRYAKAYGNRGSAHGDLASVEQAISDYDRAINLDPSLAQPYHNRGLARSDLGNLEQALSDLETAGSRRNHELVWATEEQIRSYPRELGLRATSHSPC